MKVKSLSRVRLLATPWTAAYQAPPSMGFSRQEYWSGVPLPSPKALLALLNLTCAFLPGRGIQALLVTNHLIIHSWGQHGVGVGGGSLFLPSRLWLWCLWKCALKMLQWNQSSNVKLHEKEFQDPSWEQMRSGKWGMVYLSQMILWDVPLPDQACLSSSSSSTTTFLPYVSQTSWIVKSSGP